MMNTLLLAALLLAQDPAATTELPTDKDAEAAVKTYRDASKDASNDDARLEAVRAALEVRHEKTIKAVQDLLTTGSDKLRVGVALALGDTDHPASVDVLKAAIGPNSKKPLALAAIAKALGTLGWESAAGPLNDLVKKAGDEEIREALPDVIDALGAIGSVTSIDPLIDLIRKFEGPRRNPWPNEGELRSSAQAALRAITGGTGGKANEWDDYWKTNKNDLLAAAQKTWWNRKTGERVTQGVADKAPADSLVVSVRLTDPPDPEAGGKGSGGRPGKKKRKGS